MSTTPDGAVRAYTEAHKAVFLSDLAEWLRVPSVPAEPDRSPAKPRGAEWPSGVDVPARCPGISVPSGSWHSVNEKADPGPAPEGRGDASAYLWGDLSDMSNRA
jgi:hypothetical protein